MSRSRRAVLRTIGPVGIAGVADCSNRAESGRDDEGSETSSGPASGTASGDAPNGSATVGDGRNSEGRAANTRTITDVADGTVEVPTDIEERVAVGAGSLCIVAQLGAVDRVVGVEVIETDRATRIPYDVANPALRGSPVIGPREPVSD